MLAEHKININKKLTIYHVSGVKRTNPSQHCFEKYTSMSIELALFSKHKWLLILFCRQKNITVKLNSIITLSTFCQQNKSVNTTFRKIYAPVYTATYVWAVHHTGFVLLAEHKITLDKAKKLYSTVKAVKMLFRQNKYL